MHLFHRKPGAVVRIQFAKTDRQYVFQCMSSRVSSAAVWARAAQIDTTFVAFGANPQAAASLRRSQACPA
jgi:hypothetical protein